MQFEATDPDDTFGHAGEKKKRRKKYPEISHDKSLPFLTTLIHFKPADVIGYKANS